MKVAKNLRLEIYKVLATLQNVSATPFWLANNRGVMHSMP